MVSFLRLSRLSVFILTAFLLSGCAETQLVSHWAKKISWPGQAESKGAYKVGNPYKVGQVWYYPEENFNLSETGIASWYGPGFHEEHTANGEIFDQNELTAAHRTLQMPSIVRVTNLENGRSIVVRVNDRGPFKSGRIMDVSKRAAELLGFIQKGTARVRIDVLEKESRILADAAKSGENTTRLTISDINKRSGLSPETAAALNPVPVPAPAVRTASAANTVAGSDADSLPESLRTPTITVEELSRGGDYVAPPVQAAPQAPAAPLAEGTIEKGRFMPAPVVTEEPVRATGIFVQAGSFSVYDNAEKLTKRLTGIAPAMIEPVTVAGRQMYRVKLGPIESVEAADRVLAKVIGIAAVTPKIVKNN